MSSPPQNETPIFTAVVCHHGNDEDDVASMLTQPLMDYDDDDSVDDDVVPQKQQKNKKEEDNRHHTNNLKSAMVIGTVIGFLVQIISLCAYGLVLLRWGEDAVHANKTPTEGIIYAILSTLTQLDLCVYVLIWLAFTCTVTKTGMNFLRNQLSCSVPSSSNDKKGVSLMPRRALFILGISFLVGIVMGAFMAWTLTDVYLGFPVPFAPIAVTVVFDLFLCYLMVRCYDVLGRKGEGDEEEEEEEEEYDNNSECC